MNRDIRINYSVLGDIRDKINKYKSAITTIQEVLNTVNSKLENENQGERIDSLKDMYTELKGDLEGCQEELEDLYTIFNDYINEMQGIISPISPDQIMQVDRNDIWWNMKDIFYACESVGVLKMNIISYGGFPDFFKTPEEKEDEENNERKMELVWDDITNCGNRLNNNIDELQSIYDNKIIPYENKDDEYKTKAGQLHGKYTGSWEQFIEIHDGFYTTIENVIKGLFNSIVDLVEGIVGLAFGLVKGAVICIGADIGMKVTQATGDAPDWLEDCMTQADEYDKAIGAILDDPILIVEGISQGVSDTVEEKGIAYCGGYLIGEVGQIIVGDKGLSKLKTISKGSKVTTAEKAAIKLKEGATQAEIRANVLKNIKESRIARESSNYKEFAEFEKTFKGPGKAIEVDLEYTADTVISYQEVFENEFRNFNDGYEIKNVVDEDLTLVQYSSDNPNASLKYWTTAEEANGISTVEEYMDKLALSKEWGARDTIKVSRIPKGTEVKYAVGTAKAQTKIVDMRPGGGLQLLFSEFDTNWIKKVRSLPKK